VQAPLGRIRFALAIAVVAGAALAAAPVMASAAVSAPGGGAALSHTTLLRAAASLDTQTSSNWAGYTVSGGTFTSVTSSWVQPQVTCTPGRVTYSSFWVGLGGFSPASQALEQIGTEADCTASGAPVHSAWWEIVPDAMVPIQLDVEAGDTVTATVTVSGQTVSFELDNVTRGTSFTHTVEMTAAPDVSSAEWIAEAPSACSSFGSCRVLPLSNFGSVAFSGASATGDAGTATIATSPGAQTVLQLRGRRTTGSFRVRSTAQLVSDALPGPLADTGDAFSVSWSQRLA
jgi:hypothetical protein